MNFQKAEPVKPGDLAIIIDSDWPHHIGGYVKCIRWAPDNPGHLQIEGDILGPPPGEAYWWVSLPKYLLKISPDTDQFTKEREKERETS